MHKFAIAVGQQRVLGVDQLAGQFLLHRHVDRLIHGLDHVRAAAIARKRHEATQKSLRQLLLPVQLHSRRLENLRHNVSDAAPATLATHVVQHIRALVARQHHQVVLLESRKTAHAQAAGDATSR